MTFFNPGKENLEGLLLFPSVEVLFLSVEVFFPGVKKTSSEFFFKWKNQMFLNTSLDGIMYIPRTTSVEPGLIIEPKKENKLKEFHICDVAR